MANLIRSIVDWFHEVSENRITPKQAMQLPPMSYGVNKITGHCARLPLFLKLQLKDGGQSKAVDHWAYRKLLTQPNQYQTADTFKQQITGHALLWGNGRAAIVNNGSRDAELIPLMPDRTMSMLVAGRKFHFTKPEKEDRLNALKSIASDANGTIVISDDDVIHIQGFGFDGIEGLSLVGQMRRTLGIPTEQEEHAYNQTKKGFVAKLMVESPVGMFNREADAKEWIEQFNKSHSSAENAGKAGLLRNGMKATVLSMSNDDAQFLEQRRYSRQDIALMLGLDGMPGDGDSHSYNSKEMESLNYLDTGLAPWACKWEMQVDTKILTERERSQGYFSMFDFAELLRTDAKTQAEIHAIRIASRIYNPNKCREELGENPYKGGDEYINPAISPANAQQPAPTPKTPTQPKQSAAIESQLRHMVRVEAKRVVQHSEDKNYLTWMDKWYAEWECTLADKLEEIGLDRDLATIHCTESKRLLVEASNSKPEAFKATLTECVSDWENRIFAMINPTEHFQSRTEDKASKRFAEVLTAIASQQPPVINITVPQPEATIVNVAVPEQIAPVVNVTVPKQDAPVVNVISSPQLAPVVNVTVPEQKAPIVNVTNDVKPATVDVNVSIPARRTTTKVKRDNNGAITGSEQLEEDA